ERLGRGDGTRSGGPVIEGHVSAIPVEGRPYQGHHAGLVTRVTAAVIDFVVVVLLLVVAYACVASARFVLHPRAFSFPSAAIFVSVWTALIVLALYLTVSWSVTGRTLGDQILGVRVIGPGGRPPGTLISAGRAVVCTLFPIGLFWCAFSRTNRSIQDILF